LCHILFPIDGCIDSLLDLCREGHLSGGIGEGQSNDGA